MALPTPLYKLYRLFNPAGYHLAVGGLRFFCPGLHVTVLFFLDSNSIFSIQLPTRKINYNCYISLIRRIT